MGGRIQQETRRYDESAGETIPMRVKEGSSDYRYFPEPDPPPYEVSDEWTGSVRKILPELPEDRRAKHVNEFGLTVYDVAQSTVTKATSDFFESAVALGGDVKQVFSRLQSEVAQFLSSENKTPPEIPLTSKNLVEMLAIIVDGMISSEITKKVSVHLAKNGGFVREYVERVGSVQTSNSAVPIPIIHQIFEDNETVVASSKSGKHNVDKAFTGFSMKTTKGKANPQTALELLA